MSRVSWWACLVAAVGLVAAGVMLWRRSQLGDRGPWRVRVELGGRVVLDVVTTNKPARWIPAAESWDLVQFPPLTNGVWFFLSGKL